MAAAAINLMAALAAVVVGILKAGPPVVALMRTQHLVVLEAMVVAGAADLEEGIQAAKVLVAAVAASPSRFWT